MKVTATFTVIPLIQFTSDKIKMGEFANPLRFKILAWFVPIVFASLNAYLLVQTSFG